MFRLPLVCLATLANAANLAPALRLRGGLGDLDGGAVAKAFVTLAGVDAGLSTISGAKSVGDVVDNWATGDLASTVGFYLAAKGLLDGDGAAKTTVNYLTPVLAARVKKWLDGGLAIDLSPSTLSLLSIAFMTYVFHTGSILDPDLANKIQLALCAVFGLGGMFVPDLVAKIPLSGAPNPAVFTGLGAALYALGDGKDGTKALAYGVIPSLYESVKSVLIDKSGTGDENIATIRMLIEAAVVACNLL